MSELPSILIVDDEQSARETLEALLHADGYRLEFAASGQAAIDRLRGPPVDLVICDVMMPGIHGFEVCRRIKADEHWRLVPVILATALDGPDDMVRGIESGADEFLTKPMDRVVLRSRVRAMLRIRSQYRELQQRAANVDDLLQRRRNQIAQEGGLSDREREVLDLLLMGRTHEEIGKVLKITPRTAKFHQANVLEKLGADSRVDLIRIFL